MGVEIIKETSPEMFSGHTPAGTVAVQLTVLDHKLLRGILLRCAGPGDAVANTVPVWVGKENVTADSDSGTGGMPIIPGESMFLPIEKATLLWIVSIDENQDVAWLAI